MTQIFPVYRFTAGHWGKREYLGFFTTDSRALDFACAWNRANPLTNGCYLAPSTDAPPEAALNTYHGWALDFEYGYHTATHANYDASWEGDEDGWVDNGLKESARSLEDLLTIIDERETEECPDEDDLTR